MRWSLLLALCASLGRPALAEDPVGGAPIAAAVVPPSLVATALEAHPTIAARDHAARAAGLHMAAAGPWPDPVVGIEYSNVPLSQPILSGHPMSGLQLRVQQRIPSSGERAAQSQLAHSQHQKAQAERDLASISLVEQVHMAWWQLRLVRELRAITERHLRLTEQLEPSLRARYEVGRSGQSAVIRLQLLRARLADDLDDYAQQERSALASLRAALAAGPELDVDTSGALVPTVLRDGVADWLALAQDRHPAFAAYQAAAAAGEQGAVLAKAQGRPDLSVWAGYRLRVPVGSADVGADLVSIGVSAPIGVSSRRAAESHAGASLATAEQARRSADLMTIQLRAALEDAEAQWQRSLRKADTYATTLIPDAEAALSASLADFRVGGAQFDALYQAEVVLLDLERARVRALIQSHVLAVRVAALTAEPPDGARWSAL